MTHPNTVQVTSMNFYFQVLRSHANCKKKISRAYYIVCQCKEKWTETVVSKTTFLTNCRQLKVVCCECNCLGFHIHTFILLFISISIHVDPHRKLHSPDTLADNNLGLAFKTPVGHTRVIGRAQICKVRATNHRSRS